ncbi:MAG TPA: anti-sigma factor [Gaiellaceae bacterium]|nr:anti-sigma factor [Gaiellaceae bacterium]
MSGPDFDALVEDVGGEQRDRLREVHELLLAAGPPPELPPSLEHAPGSAPRPAVRLMPRRRLGAALVLAAALALAAFGSGYLVAARSGPDAGFHEDFALSMRGTGAAPEAAASLLVGEIDSAGNWPMEMTVHGLPELPSGQRYELLLTRGGRPAASCGTFVVHGTTVVFLNAPYRLRRYDGWVVTREGDDRALLRTDEI